MKKACKLTLAVFLFLFVTIQLSFSQFGISGELRVRPEYRHGYKSLASPGQDPAFFISQRARLNFKYGAERFSFFVSLQDVRTWGSTSQLNLSDDFLSVHQAWGELNISEKFGLRVGRQELVYDNHRILGNVNWAQQGRSHDVALLKFEMSTFKWHTGLAFNQDKEQLSTTYYSVKNNYKTMQFIWLNNTFENSSGSILFLNNGVQSPDSSTVYSQTMGTYWMFALGNLDLNVGAYYQVGKDPAKKDLSAGYANIDLSWPLSFGLTPFIGFEYLSGTNQSNSETNGSFTPLFGTNHKFNGHMDYFYVGNHLNDVGLTNPYLGLVYKWKKWTLYSRLHYFASAAEILDPSDPTTALSNGLGVELDLSLALKISENISLSTGYSHMFASISMEAIKGGDSSTTNNWAWMMLAFTPDFFKSKNTD